MENNLKSVKSDMFLIVVAINFDYEKTNFYYFLFIKQHYNFVLVNFRLIENIYFNWSNVFKLLKSDP